MTQDLQQLLDKIQRDGVDKATAEAEKIVEKAKAQAEELLKKAKAEATGIIAASRHEAEAFERRAEETIRQAARDTVMSVQRSVTALLTNVLLKEVNASLATNTELTAGLAAEAVRAYLTGKNKVEVAACEKLADALRAKLAAAAQSGVEVTIDEHTGAGFRILLADGRIDHTFTGSAVAEALARQLRPRLAALMKTEA